MSAKNPPVVTSRSRRSARRRGQEHDPVVAPGFGTKKDIDKLTKDLSAGSDAKLPVAAVEGVWFDVHYYRCTIFVCVFIAFAEINNDFCCAILTSFELPI